MKLVVAIIKPFKLDEVQAALVGLGVTGMTVTNVSGIGRQRGHVELYRGTEYATSLVPKARVEVVVADAAAAGVVDVIRQAARTGKIGDGKLFVLDVARAVRIRTGETDEDAI